VRACTSSRSRTLAATSSVSDRCRQSVSSALSTADPTPSTSVDYSLLFGVALFDYVKASGDCSTGVDLFPIAVRQFELAMARVGPDFIYNLPPPVEEEGGQWVFIDWQETLDKAASIHAVVVFALRSLSELAVLLGIPSPTLHPPYASAPLTLDELVKEMTAAARSAWPLLGRLSLTRSVASSSAASPASSAGRPTPGPS